MSFATVAPFAAGAVVTGAVALGAVVTVVTAGAVVAAGAVVTVVTAGAVVAGARVVRGAVVLGATVTGEVVLGATVTVVAGALTKTGAALQPAIVNDEQSLANKFLIRPYSLWSIDRPQRALTEIQSPRYVHQ